jgi:glycine betaine transporter
LDWFDFRYCSIILCLPLRKQRLGNENQLILILAGLLYCTVLEWVSGLLLRAVQEPTYYLNNPPVETANNKVTALQYTFFSLGFTPWAMYSLFGLICINFI